MDPIASNHLTDRPWLGEYPPEVRAEIDMTGYASAAALLEHVVARYARRVAFEQLGVHLTYAELGDRTARLAAYFQQDLRLQPGDRIALMMPNVIQYPIALFAALRAGLTVVNVNPLYTAPELLALVTDSKPRAIIVLETFAATVEKALKAVTIETVIVARIAELQAFPRSLIVDYVVRKRKKLVPAWTIPGAVLFKRAVSRRAAATFRAPVLTHDTMALLQYTGGTTAAPKGTVLTHGNVIAQVLMMGAWCKPVLRPAQETFLIAMPLYHVAALLPQCLNALQYGGRSILVVNPRDIPALVKDFATHKPTVFGGLNTLFNALMANEAFAKLDFTALRLVVAGGTATQSSVAERWQALTGQTILEGYGLSETSGAVTANPAGRTRFDGSVGVPLPSMRIEIRDDQGAKLPFDTPGEIHIKGPSVMTGYFNRPEETASVIGRDLFLATGDIGVMSDKGILRIIDRKKDMILVSGFNVYPNEVEDALSRHPGVAEVGVIGMPDTQCGEAPVACVVKRDPALTEADLVAFARENLAPYKIPRRIVFIETIPKTIVGKILRRELVEQIKAD